MNLKRKAKHQRFALGNSLKIATHYSKTKRKKMRGTESSRNQKYLLHPNITIRTSRPNININY